MATAGRVVVIGGSDAVLGLGLLGIDGVEAHDEAEARAALARLLDDPSTSLVLLDETIGRALADALEAAAEGAEHTLVVEIPSGGVTAPEGSLRSRVERALGLEWEG